MKRLHFFISDPQYAELKRLKMRRDIPLAEMLRAAIDLYLQQKKERPNVLDDCSTPRVPPDPPAGDLRNT